MSSKRDNPSMLRESQRGMDTYADAVNNPKDSGLKSNMGQSQQHKQQQSQHKTPMQHGHHPREGTPEREAKRKMHQTAGVCEASPGIIESTHIDPLHELYNVNQGGKERLSVQPSATSYVSSAAKVVSGGAKMAYGTLVGDEETAQAGKHDVYGN